MKQPAIGMIAKCSTGKLGLITQNGMQERGGELVWVGVHLSEGRVGHQWQSKNPTVICHINDVEDLVSAMEATSTDSERRPCVECMMRQVTFLYEE
jgi:GTP:adenosylcobinamide-phosphate guanylyltransferase